MFLNDSHTIILMYMTATDRSEGGKLFAKPIIEGRLRQVWLPNDLAGAVRCFIKHLSPRCGILIEREVWPNLIRAANEQHVPIALVNARLSERSARRNRLMHKNLDTLPRDTIQLYTRVALPRSQKNGHSLCGC
jgi:3-deoxy-D-manno-octulosonic-acid transferase